MEQQPNSDSGRRRLLAAGGLVGALLASSCCIVPLVLLTLGVSGAWIGNLTGLGTLSGLFHCCDAGVSGVGILVCLPETKRYM